MKNIAMLAVLFALIASYGYCDVEHKTIVKDGKKVDIWGYNDDKGVPVKGVQAVNGKENNWSFFENGRAFIDEADTTGNGKVNQIILTIWDKKQRNSREILLVLKDKGKNIFEVEEDTDWKGLDYK